MTNQLNGGRVLVRAWPLLLAGLVAGALIGFGATFLMPKAYTASSQLYVVAAGGGSASDTAQGATYVDGQISAYQTLATSDVVLQPVIDDLGLDMTTRELADDVAVESTSGVLAISTSAADAEDSVKINDAVIEELTTQITDLSPVSSDGKPLVEPHIVSSAAEPTSPSSPQRLLTTAIGAAIGLALAAAAAFAMAARRLARTATAAHVGDDVPAHVQAESTAPTLDQTPDRAAERDITERG